MLQRLFFCLSLLTFTTIYLCRCWISFQFLSFCGWDISVWIFVTFGELGGTLSFKIIFLWWGCFLILCVCVGGGGGGGGTSFSFNFFFCFVVDVYYFLFNIHSFIHTIFLCFWGSVSVGWCAFFVFGQQQLNNFFWKIWVGLRRAG